MWVQSEGSERLSGNSPLSRLKCRQLKMCGMAVAEHVEPDKELWSFKHVPEDVLAQILHMQCPLPNFKHFGGLTYFIWVIFTIVCNFKDLQEYTPEWCYSVTNTRAGSGWHVKAPCKVLPRIPAPGKGDRGPGCKTVCTFCGHVSSTTQTTPGCANECKSETTGNWKKMPSFENIVLHAGQAEKKETTTIT